MIDSPETNQAVKTGNSNVESEQRGGNRSLSDDTGNNTPVNRSDENTDDEINGLYLITKNYPSRDSFIEGITLIKVTKSSRDVLRTTSREHSKHKRIKELIVGSYDIRHDDSNPSLKSSKASAPLPRTPSQLNVNNSGSGNDSVGLEEIEIRKSIIYEPVQTTKVKVFDSKTEIPLDSARSQNKLNSNPGHNIHEKFIYKTNCSCHLRKSTREETPGSYPSPILENENYMNAKREKMNPLRKGTEANQNIIINIKIKSKLINLITVIGIVFLAVATVCMAQYCIHSNSNYVAYKFQYSFPNNISLGDGLDRNYERIFLFREMSFDKGVFVIHEIHLFSQKRNFSQWKNQENTKGLEESSVYKDIDAIKNIVDNVASKKIKEEI